MLFCTYQGHQFIPLSHDFPVLFQNHRRHDAEKHFLFCAYVDVPGHAAAPARRHVGNEKGSYNTQAFVPFRLGITNLLEIGFKVFS